MKNRDFFDIWIKNKVDVSNDNPPEDIWTNISNDLDIKSVWTNVDSELTRIEGKRKRRRVFVYFIFSGSLLLLSYLIFTTITSPKTKNSEIVYNKNDTRSQFFISNNKPSDIESNVDSQIKEQNSLKTSQQAHSTQKNNVKVNSNDFSTFHRSKKNNKSELKKSINDTNLVGSSRTGNLTETFKLINSQNDSAKKEIILPDYLSIKYLQMNDLDSSIMTQVFLDSSYYIRDFAPKQNVTGFYFGMIFSAQNSWLLNTKTLGGLSKNSLDLTLPHYGFSYGISAGYYLKSGWSLESDLFFDSQYGQSYDSYQEGSYVNEKINLHYYQLNLYTVKRNGSELRNKNFSLSQGPLFGVESKFLNYAEGKNNETSVLVTKQYTKYDLGLLFGYNLDLQVKKKCILFSSIVGDFGFYNVYSGTSYEPKAFNKTFNSSLRLSFGVKYFIK